MSPKMKRMDLYVEPEVAEELKRIAAVRQVSVSHLLREAMRREVEEEERRLVKTRRRTLSG